MRIRTRSSVILATALLAAGAALVGSPVQAAGGYRAVELNVEGWAEDINNVRQVTGSFINEDLKWHPFLWEHGRLTDLGALRSGANEFAYARDINNRGQVVGDSAVAWGDEDVNSHAFLWDHGVMTDLGTLGGEDSVALAINDRGQVFGSSSVAPGEHHAFRWERGVMTDLGPFRVADANDRGQVVGDDVLWDRGVVTRLGFPSAAAINNAGWIAGNGYDETMTQHGYLLRSGVVTDLGVGSYAIDLNNRGVVLSDGYGGPFLWRAGRVTHLASFGVTSVNALNDRGDLAGTTTPDDGSPGHPVVYLR
ncbi:hypothetical protein [Actinoplanes sp. NPDC049316]|uniref:hypothetical protein n=1 Tax=Actinoplanes sp. NPDC049316 TaxID=3154727 RepID=UPI0034473642